MKIQFTMKSLENVPYKLVYLLDKTKIFTSRGSRPINEDLKLMIFESGEIVGFSNEKDIPPSSNDHRGIIEHLVIGRAHENLVGSLVGPMIKMKCSDKLGDPFSYANITYLLEDEVTSGGFFGWTGTNNGNKIERILDKIKSAKPNDALYRRIQEEPFVFEDIESSAFIESLEKKSKRLSEKIRYYKRY